MLYVDPWADANNDARHEDPNTRTGGDCMAYYKDINEFTRGGDGTYRGVFLVEWSDLHKRNIFCDQSFGLRDNTLKDDPSTPLQETVYIRKAEMRFRFIGKGGMAYPQPTVSVKGDWDSNFRWFFRMQRHWNGLYSANEISYYVPDVVERYSAE